MTLPQPFQRPGISLSTEKRDWRQVNVYSVREGDLVNGMGLVTNIWDSPAGPVFQFKSGTQQSYTEGDTVFAFVVV